MGKYKFRKGYEDSIIDIPFLKLKVTRFNITDDLVEMINKKYPKFSHNFELENTEEVNDLEPAPLSDLQNILDENLYVDKDLLEVSKEDIEQVEESIEQGEESVEDLADHVQEVLNEEVQADAPEPKKATAKAKSTPAKTKGKNKS